MGVARIGLGSNLGDAHAHVEAAIAAQTEIGTLLARSGLYRSKAWGVCEQPDFINAVVSLETELAPRELLRALKHLEARLGRVETYRWGPRLIDLDILTYDALILNEPDLVLPHPRLFERAFVLAPLSEIDPTYLAAYERLPLEERAEVSPFGTMASVRRSLDPIWPYWSVPDALFKGLPLAGRSLAAPERCKLVSISWDEALERVRQVVTLCVEGDLERLRVEEDDFSLEVSRTARPASGIKVSQAASPSEAREPGHHGAQDSAGNGAVYAASESIMLKAEFVGILRFSRPIVTEGSVVSEDRELAYVESLGTRNPVRAAGRGAITAVHVTDGQAVDYGHPLFAVTYE